MHRSIFEHIIYQLLEEDFVSLAKKSFKDRTNRTRKFVDKLKNKENIDLTNGEQVIINKVVVDGKTYDENNFEDLIEVLPQLSRESNIKFYSGTKEYKISAFAKTTELGGKGKGGTLVPERNAIASLQKQFEEIKTPISLNIGGKVFSNIDGIANVKENQKADFVFTSDTEPVYISYKAGSSAKNVLFYGGIALYKDSDEVKRFIEVVKSRTSAMSRGSVEYAAPVRDSEVAIKVLFGSKYSPDTPGENSIQAIVQGNNLRLVPTGDGAYTLSASKIILAPNIPDEVDYAPFYNARYADDRDQFGIKNCRFTIVPGGAREGARMVSISSKL